MIKVRFYGIAYDKTGIREWHVELNDGESISNLLDQIVASFTELNKFIKNENGSIRDYFVISLNNVDIKVLNGVNTSLKTGDIVFIMPPIGGG